MKENRAEEIISRKVREHESEAGLPPEHGELLWSQLDKRLEQKKRVPVVRYYTLRAAAAILILFILGLCLYPARKTNTVQTAAIQTVETNNTVLTKELPPVQQLPDTTAANTRQKTTVAHRNKRDSDRKEEKVNTTEEQEEKSSVYAGLYAMPQPACSDVSAEQYQQCYQTL